MNERIKELALQAGGGLSCIAEPLEHPWKFSQSALEKFSKRVVLECARVVKASSPNGMIGVTAIRIHFGVEP